MEAVEELSLAGKYVHRDRQEVMIGAVWTPGHSCWPSDSWKRVAAGHTKVPDCWCRVVGTHSWYEEDPKVKYRTGDWL